MTSAVVKIWEQKHDQSKVDNRVVQDPVYGPAVNGVNRNKW